MDVAVSPPLLEVRSISKAFGGVHALQNVDMTVFSGTITALVGENGAGKSTLIRCITCLSKFDSGQLLMDGQVVNWRTPHDVRRSGVEAVHQSLGLVDSLDVASNIFLGREKAAGWLRGRQLAIRPMRSEAQLMLEKFGAAIPVRSLVSNLSGGQRQAVSIIRATAWGARLVVMDEPTAALGVQEAKRVLDVMRSLADKGLAILMISHNLDQVCGTADTAWVLRRGRMVAKFIGSDILMDNLVRSIVGYSEEK